MKLSRQLFFVYNTESILDGRSVQYGVVIHRLRRNKLQGGIATNTTTSLGLISDADDESEADGWAQYVYSRMIVNHNIRVCNIRVGTMLVRSTSRQPRGPKK